jgi:hypothetical protein
MTTTENRPGKDLALTITTGVLAIAVTVFAALVLADMFLA